MTYGQEKVLHLASRYMAQSYAILNRTRLTDNDVTIISNNCWGGNFERHMGRGYSSPFVNLFIYADCYLKIISSIEKYVNCSPLVDRASRYRGGTLSYPIIHLIDVELHCIHYVDDDVALANWLRRAQRMKMCNMFFVFSMRDGATSRHAEIFLSSAEPNRLMFSYESSADPRQVRLRYGSSRGQVGPADIIAGPSYWNSNIVSRLNSCFG